MAAGWDAGRPWRTANFACTLGEGGVLTVGLRRAKVNAMSRESLLALGSLFRDASEDARVLGVLVVSEQEKAFCAGLDLGEARSLGAGEHAVAEYIGLIGSGLSAPLSCTKPVAAAVDGHAIAGGFVLAAACDFVALGTRRPFKCGVNEVNIGMAFPRVAIEVVRNHVGGGGRGFRRLAQDGVLVGQKEAFALGFGDVLVADPERACREWLAHKVALRPGVWRITKRHVNHQFFQQLGDADPVRTGARPVPEQDVPVARIMLGGDLPSHL